MPQNGPRRIYSEDKVHREDFKRILNERFDDLYQVVYDDLREPLNGKNLYATPGTADYDFANGWIVLQNGGDIGTVGDVVGSTYQLPHGWKLGTDALLHLHWYQTTETSRTITGKHRLLRNGAVPSDWVDFTATCTYAADNAYAWVAGGLMQLTRLATIDLSTAGLSDLIQVRLTRSDANAVNDMYALYMDMHIQLDTRGSSLEYIK